MDTLSQDLFELIHRVKAWHVVDFQDRVCRDHFGSRICATTAIRHALPQILTKYKIQTMLDLGCGTFHWMPYMDFPKEVSYHGIDICSSKIEENKSKYPHYKWSVLDVTEDELPPADLYFMRDVLCYLPDHKIKQFFENIQRVESGYLLVSSHLPIDTNKSIGNNIGTTNGNSCRDGDYRHVDLLSPPFKLQATPIEIIEDHRPCISDRPEIPYWANMHLYKTKDLRKNG